MWNEFKEFALKGNALSLAIGVIIGAAFGKIVDALVNDIIMPIIGVAGKADFSNYYIPLSSAVTATNLTDARKQGGVLAYGDFISPRGSRGVRSYWKPRRSTRHVDAVADRVSALTERGHNAKGTRSATASATPGQAGPEAASLACS